MGLFKKKISIFLACSALAAFLAILTIETFHHHESLEGSDDCTICSWQVTGSQAPSTPAPPPPLIPILLVSLVFFFQPFVFSFHFISPSGRSPPKNLL